MYLVPTVIEKSQNGEPKQENIKWLHESGRKQRSWKVYSERKNRKNQRGIKCCTNTLNVLSWLLPSIVNCAIFALSCQTTAFCFARYASYAEWGKSEHRLPVAKATIGNHVSQGSRRVTGNACTQQCARCEQWRLERKRKTSLDRWFNSSSRDEFRGDAEVQRLNPYFGARPYPAKLYVEQEESLDSERERGAR